jgi:hypothetical protein
VRRLGGQRGQTTAEYLGLLVLVALIVTAIGATGLKDTVVAGMQAAGAAPTRQASLELPPVPLPHGGTLIPPSDDPTVRELSGAENLEAAFDALLEGDVLGVAGAGPAAGIPRGTPGFDAYLRTHVEGHAAAILRQQGGGQARLVINQVPCPNCDRNLPRALPEGAELELLGPGGFRKTYRGLPD